MTTLTDTELSASGDFINLGSPAALDNLGSRTHIFFCHPTALAGGTFPYIYGKTPSGSGNGERIFLTGSTGSPRWACGLSSTGNAAFPTRNSVDDAAVLNRDQLVAITFDGTLEASGIHLYAEVADASGVLTGVLAEVSASVSGDGADGIGSLIDDSSLNSFLLNRDGLSRHFVGTLHWHGLWDHVKDLTAINAIAADYVAGTGGPLDETTGLVLFWANQADLSPSALTETARSTYAAGSLPDYTELGGSVDPAITGTGAITLDDVVAAGTGTASEGETGITGTGAVTLDGVVAAGAGKTAFFYDDFDTSSIRIAGATITGVGDAAVFSIDPRNIISEAAPPQSRWLHSIFEIRGGIAGLRPIIEFQDYTNWHGKLSGTNWQSTRRLYYREWNGSAWGSWANFGGAPTVGVSTVQYQHSIAFGSVSRVQIATTIPYSVEDDEVFLAAFAASYPAAVKNALSNTTDFRSIEYSSQTTDLGTATGTEFSLSAVIDDDNQTNPSGAKGDATINAGVHGGEHQGKRMFRALVTRLMGDETKANYLRSILRFHIRPTLNPIGGDHGHWRGDWGIAPGETTQTTDLNRNATDTSTGLDLVDNFQAINAQDYAGRTVQNIAIDLHGSFGSASPTEFIGFYNVDEIATLGAFRTALEVYLGAGVISDFGPSVQDTVEHAYRTVWGTTLSATIEMAEQLPRSDTDFDTYADAIVQSLYDMIQAGDLHFNVGTGAATLDGVTAAGTGTTADQSITGTGAITLAGVIIAGTGTATGPILGAPQAGGMLINVNRLMNR